MRLLTLSNSILNSLPDEVLKDYEARYKKFLLLISKYPKEVIAPTEAIDEMWHILGYLLDHNPGIGKIPGTLDTLLGHFKDTTDLWVKEFGDKYSPPVNGLSHNVVMCATDPDPKDKEDDHSPKSKKPQSLFIANRAYP